MGKITYHTKANPNGETIIDDIHITDDVSVLNLDTIYKEMKMSYYSNICIDLRNVNKQFPNVDTIIAEHAIFSEIKIRNNMFPNVKKIFQQEKQCYLCVNNRSKILCNIFSQPDIIDLSSIRIIHDYAFEGLQKCKIVNTDNLLEVEEHAFDGSWLEDLSKEQDIVYYANMLIYVSDKVKTLDIPENINIVRDNIHFQESMDCVTIHSTKILKYLNNIHIKKLIFQEISYNNAEKMVQNLSLYNILVDEIYFSDDNIFFRKENGIIYSKDMTHLLYCPSGITGDIQISDKTLYVGFSSFANSRIDSVVIPDSVRDIGSGAFADSTVKDVKLGAGIKSFDSCQTGAFQRCKNLKHIEIPSNIKEIGRNTFSESGLQSVILYEGVERIIGYAFYRCCEIRKIELPDSLKFLGSNNFSNITDITINHGIHHFISNLYTISRERKTFICIHFKDKKFYLSRHYTKQTLKIIDDLFSEDFIDDICAGQKEYCKSTEDKQYISYLMYCDNSNDEDNKSYLKKISCQLAKKMIKNGDTENLLRLLSFGFISTAGLEKLYDKTDNTVVKAYISQALNTDRHSVSFRL